MFGFLFRPKSPTRDWVRSPGLRLTFDLDRTTLNGVSLGGDFQRLSFLGPDEDRKSSRAGVFCYYSLGLCVDAEIESSPSAVTCFQLVFHDPDEDRYETFAGSVLFRGRAARLAETDVDGFVGHIGEPYWIDRDEDETILFYEFPDREWQVEFDDAEMIKRVVVTAHPLLSEIGQREAYGVNKPWPPADFA